MNAGAWWSASTQRVALRALLALLLIGCQANVSFAQRRGQGLRNLIRGAISGGAEIEAVAGEPYGVGRVSLSVAGNTDREDPLEWLRISERGDQLSYPAYDLGNVRGLVRDALNVPAKVNIYFLFQGREPLDVQCSGSQKGVLNVTPIVDGRRHERLLKEWWQAYATGRRDRQGDPLYPPQIENYLAVMLANRLRLPMPTLRDDPESPGEIVNALALLAGTESTRIAIEKSLLLGDSRRPEPANLPLPPALEWRAPQLDSPQPPPKIEPLAEHVPPESLYIRFGSFANFQWMRDRLDQWGGELRNLITERGLDYGGSRRVERQLGVHETALGKLFGGAVIVDVAFVGLDAFVRDGAAFGILFQARSNAALASDLNRQRREAMGKMAGAVESTVEIGGRQVSLIESPGHEIRSFYVADGDFHLVTTSATLVRRFLEVGQSHASLAATADFLHAREQIPIDRDDAVFIYLSRPFFQNLLSPHYRVESLRRGAAIAEMELYQLARLTASGERQPDQSLAALVRAGYLPNGFGERPDGSALVVEENGALSDSLRGGRGSFVPIPDVEISGVTPREARAAEQFAAKYAEAWGAMEPVVVGLKREPVDVPGLERISIDAYASPLEKKHFDFANRWLGPPTDQRLLPVEGDLASFQFALAGRDAGSESGPYFLMGGLRNAVPSMPKSSALIELLASLAGFQGIHGYLAAWPHVGILRWIGAGGEAPIDPSGFSQLRFGLWRRVWLQFTAVSFHPEVLAEVTPQFDFYQSPRPAQAWVQAGDLINSRLADFINSWAFKRVRRVSGGNAHLLNSMIEQLRVPPERCLAEVESLLDARVVCPLGGEYQLTENAAGQPIWASTRAPNANRPADYLMPALYWLRGLNAEVAVEPASLRAHLDLVMPTKTDLPATAHAAPPLAPAPRASVEEIPTPRAEPPIPVPGGGEPPRAAPSRPNPPNSKPRGGNSREF